ncbi:hypothetical protein CCACVL1_04881, partial [Corchorus capsularis]
LVEDLFKQKEFATIVGPIAAALDIL